MWHVAFIPDICFINQNYYRPFPEHFSTRQIPKFPCPANGKFVRLATAKMSKFFISDQSAFDLTYDIANAFRQAGDEVHLVSGRIGPRLRKDVVLERVTPYDKSSSIKRILTWLKGTWDIFRIFRKNKDAELFIISNPPLAPLLPLFLKNTFSLLIWDIWPDALVHTKTLSAKHPFVPGNG